MLSRKNLALAIATLSLMGSMSTQASLTQEEYFVFANTSSAQLKKAFNDLGGVNGAQTLDQMTARATNSDAAIKTELGGPAVLALDKARTIHTLIDNQATPDLYTGTNNVRAKVDGAPGTANLERAVDDNNTTLGGIGAHTAARIANLRTIVDNQTAANLKSAVNAVRTKIDNQTNANADGAVDDVRTIVDNQVQANLKTSVNALRTNIDNQSNTNAFGAVNAIRTKIDNQANANIDGAVDDVRTIVDNQTEANLKSGVNAVRTKIDNQTNANADGAVDDVRTLVDNQTAANLKSGVDAVRTKIDNQTNANADGAVDDVRTIVDNQTAANLKAAVNTLQLNIDNQAAANATAAVQSVQTLIGKVAQFDAARAQVGTLAPEISGSVGDYVTNASNTFNGPINPIGLGPAYLMNTQDGLRRMLARRILHRRTNDDQATLNVAINAVRVGMTEDDMTWAEIVNVLSRVSFTAL